MGAHPNFTDVFAAHKDPIYNYLLHVTQDPAEAEDLTQETFVRVHRGLPGFRGESSLSTWIYRIATNASRDFFQRLSSAQQRGGKRDNILIQNYGLAATANLVQNGRCPD